MLVRVPLTRSVPEATAVANGERPVENSRAYGSSDVSFTRSVMSPGYCPSSVTLPVPETARRGEAASNSKFMSSPRITIRPVTSPIPSSLTNKSRRRPFTS